MPKTQVQLFRDVLEALDRKLIPYAVSGAFALRQHTGICRETKDLDVHKGAERRARVGLFAAAGMECEVSDPVWLSKARRGDYFVDLISGMSNGVLEVQDSWIERAHPAVIYGVTTRVLAPEEFGGLENLRCAARTI